jgi:C-terminal processing protease CtpA/Prc
MRILPGNIRYTDLTNFGWEGKTPQAVTDAARFLGGGDAVIIDLRHNGGGSPDAVRAMISYFMPADHRLLMSYHDGVTGKTNTSHVTDKLDAPRMVGKPLYVLISGNTGSAAEEFAYHIKNFKLGTLVGETTGGAANNDTTYPVAPGFIVSISTGRAIHPVTGTNWEGVGVPPDVSVPAGKALDRAQLLALQKLAATPGPHAQDYAWAIAGETAKLSPAAKLDVAAMGEYAGAYGDRAVRIENGALIFQRQGRPPRTMSLMSPDLFTLDTDDQFRLRFQRANGKIAGFDIMTADGQTVSVNRSP